jgi:hypothetical protein
LRSEKRELEENTLNKRTKKLIRGKNKGEIRRRNMRRRKSRGSDT